MVEIIQLAYNNPGTTIAFIFFGGWALSGIISELRSKK
jgi:hypothetical protein